MDQVKNPNHAKRGFGSMDKELQRKIASEGGKSSHKQGRAHEFTSEEARAAAKKGVAAKKAKMEARKAAQSIAETDNG